MSKKSTQVALGGVFSSLCLVLMFLTGVFPFSTYAIPAIAGVMLIPVVVENGAKTAVLVYVTVSILSIFIAADKEAAMIFIVFFGYYPIVKSKIEGIPSRVLEYAIKLLLFNAAVVSGYLAVIYLLGMPDILGEMGEFGQYSTAVMLLIGNFIFIVYDFLLTRYITLYVRWFKPTFLRK